MDGFIPQFFDFADEMGRTTVDQLTVSWDSEVARAQRLLVSLDFYREHVAQARPALIRGLMHDWPATRAWRSNEYLADRLDEAHGGAPHLTVACTPNGRADAVTSITLASGEVRRYFVSPLERRMTARGLLEAVCGAAALPEELRVRPYEVDLASPATHRSIVAYAQLQNDCLNTEYAALREDIGPSLPEFGRTVFGADPEATNVWIGGAASVTSMHQDWYENLYAVVRGTKQFVLVPPWEAPLLSKAEVPDAVYERVGDSWCVSVSESGAQTTSWIDIDLIDDDLSGDGAARHLHVARVDASAGEVLYLPAAWFHRVAQRPDSSDRDGCVIAVNMWFDMQFVPAVGLTRVLDAGLRPWFNAVRADRDNCDPGEGT